ncbi:MB2 protein [Plasmodium vivax Mauritania I]|uniref:Translation initiation factor IF-2, chloroplastic n=1 Tax=Plasmodium vivax Mauritania I TaxID=1035515 RepID=A0A0J9TC43_PLAVI|nr:MB2 protein [Plasmodium vivax Mauritania I]
MFGGWLLAPTTLLIVLYSSLRAKPNCCYAYKLPTGRVSSSPFNPCVQLRQRKGSLVRGNFCGRDDIVAAKRTASISDGDVLGGVDPLGSPPRWSRPSGWNAAGSLSQRVALTQAKWQKGNINRGNESKKKSTRLFLLRSEHSGFPPIGRNAWGGNAPICARPPKRSERNVTEEGNHGEDEGGGNSEIITNVEAVPPNGGNNKKRKYAKVREEKKKGNLPNVEGERFTGVATALEEKEVKRVKGVTNFGSNSISGETNASVRRSSNPRRGNQRSRDEPLYTTDRGNTHSASHGQAAPPSLYQRRGSEKEEKYKESHRESCKTNAYRYPPQLRTPEGDAPSEEDVGKTLEGEVYSVSPNAVLVKIKNTNHFGMLFKRRCNFGDDVGDLNEYFQVKQKMFVKTLGINMKKKLFYLGNVIRYNPDVKLKEGDTSKGLITKLCESYLFVKVLKNGSTGYLHRSKLFRPWERQNEGQQKGERQKGEQQLGRHNHRWSSLLKMAQFTQLFNIWDIIDVEIYERPDANFKSNYILTIPEGSKTFGKLLAYFDSLSGGDPFAHKGGDDRFAHKGGDDRFAHKGGEGPLLTQGGNTPVEDPSDGEAGDRRKRRSRASPSREGEHHEDSTRDEQRTPPRGYPFSKKNKETLHKERASTKMYRVPENATLSVFAKMTKISPSALKKFFIINESREYQSGHVLSADQMRKASDHFGVSCVVDVGGGGGQLGGAQLEVVTPGEEPTGESSRGEEAPPNGGTKLVLHTNRVESDPHIACPTENPREKSKKRNMVVTFIGHINHGKTSLFDYICKTKEREKEKGLITQNIRAFKVNSQSNDFSFTLIDTPGHEAFMPIRTRGVNISDLSILVISGEEGIQEQTVECIKLIKEHHIRVVIAVTKVDLPNVSVDRIVNDLVYYEIYTEMNGGDVQVVPCSIFNEKSVDKLVDAIFLESAFLESAVLESAVLESAVLESAVLEPPFLEPTSLEAPSGEGQTGGGVILDSFVDKNGIVSINLVQSGTLRVNDHFYAGSSYGKVKIMKDHLNKKVKVARASDPVMVIGYEKNSVPVAGDKFFVVQNEAVAEEIAKHHKNELLTLQMRGFSYGQEEGGLDRYREYIIREGAAIPEEERKQNGGDNPQEGQQEGQQEERQEERQVEDAPGKASLGEAAPREAAPVREKDPKTVYVNYFVKCDKQGTIEVLKNCLQRLEAKDTLHRVKNKIVFSSIGDITASDITYAQSFNAIIIGFNVKLSKSCPKNAKHLLSAAKASCRFIYANVLYDLISQVEGVMKEKLSSKPRGTYKGQATILKVFNVSKLGKVAGCVVNSGTVNNHSNVRILRNDRVIHIGKIVSLKIAKEEKEQVRQGDECGMGFEDFVDFLPGDAVESYQE